MLLSNVLSLVFTVKYYSFVFFFLEEGGGGGWGEVIYLFKVVRGVVTLLSSRSVRGPDLFSGF